MKDIIIAIYVLLIILFLRYIYIKNKSNIKNLSEEFINNNKINSEARINAYVLKYILEGNGL